ncbi:MAG: hypothetical protein ACRCZQ_06235 [Bacteroidales bacterium]
MSKTYGYYIAMIIILIFTSNAHAQEKKENSELYFRKPSSLRPDKTTLDSLSTLRAPSMPSRLDLIDKSSLLNLNENDHPFSLPNDTSYYMRRITLLRMVNNPQSQKYGKEYNKMYRNNYPESLQNYLKDARPAALFNGCLDPVEAIKNYKKAQRAKKVAEVIGKLNALSEKDSITIDSTRIKTELYIIHQTDTMLINKETPE